MNNICEDIRLILKDNLEKILSLRQNKHLKEDGSFVSEGDLCSEKLIKDYIETHCPEYALISEESPEHNLQAFGAEKIIVLDPIDGTENFVSGLKEWGVAVCVFEQGNHVQSMLALPELDEYVITGHLIERFESRIVGVSSSLTREDILALPEGFEYRIIGCCVYNMLQVIKGSFYSFENRKGAKVWDILPGLNLALEHNLSVTVNNLPYDGTLLRPDQKYIFKIVQK